MPKVYFNTAKKLLRCRRACLILLPRQHRARFQRGGKGHKGQYVGETAEIIAQRRADAVFTMLAAFRIRLKVAAISIFS